MTLPLLVLVAVVAGLALVLIVAARFGVSRRAVRSEARREEARLADAEDERGRPHLAA
jgi:hypothetical protein